MSFAWRQNLKIVVLNLLDGDLAIDQRESTAIASFPSSSMVKLDCRNK